MSSSTNYSVGIYCRLSRDDEQARESVSIGTQRSMLTDYCNENLYSIYDVYIDDGFTGTNFEREAFQRLLNDIDRGKINMVLAKDLSRLGRDYIQMGYYTEIYFPSKGVRYVALNDGYDSLRSTNDIAPFMNILNDMYARDISRKVKAAKLQRAKNGLSVASEAPYGYKKSLGRFVVDPEAAKIVRLIYELAAKGYGEVAIAKELQARGILCPSAHKIKTGQKRCPENWTNRRKDCEWSYHTVSCILKNRVYLGELHAHKTEVINHKTKETRRIPQSEQIITPNAHQPIIEEALFTRVQEIRSAHPCPAKHTHPHIFRGLLYCDCCGHPLSVAHRKLKYREEDLYRCVHHFYDRDECPKTHAIYHSALAQYVLQQLQSLAKSMKRRKVCSPIINYAAATELTAEMLGDVIVRIEIGHLGRKTPLSRAVRIIWKL